MTQRKAICAVAALGLVATGCISLLGPEDLRFSLSLSQGVGLDREFAIGIDGLTIGAASALAGPDVPSIKGLRWVDVGIYKIRGNPENLIADATLPGWEPIVRMRESGEEVKILVKQNRRDVHGLVALVREGDELIIVRLKGRVGQLLKSLMTEGGIDGFDLDDLFDVDAQPRVIETPDDVRDAVEREND